jgi:hypothetical protein
MQGSHSPEGQAFVLEMQAGYRDWLAAGKKGENAGTRLDIPGGIGVWMLVILVGLAIGR